jgi:hypothetical protein
MIDQCFPLDLPDLEEILLPTVDLQNYTNNIIFYHKIEEFIKPEYHRIFGYKFVEAQLFHKEKGVKSKLHIDHDRYDKNGNNPKKWGVNWNTGGTGLYKFFHNEDITSYFEGVNPQGKRHVLMDSNRSPAHSYEHSSGAVLFNAQYPHQVENLSPRTRFSISLRLYNDQFIEDWETVVEKFKNLIIPYSDKCKKIS